jgi:exosortase C (VPDSG-CTERM-specific)
MNAQIQYDVDAQAAMQSRQLRRLGVATALLALCFGAPLLQLISFAWQSEFFSYIVLVPFISGYLVWTMRRSLIQEPVRPCWQGALLAWAAAALLAGGFWIGWHGGWLPQKQDYLAVMTAAFLCGFWGLCLAFLGSKFARRIFFPLAFLAFAIPMPAGCQDSVVTFFQNASAPAAAGFLHLVGEPVSRRGLDLQLSHFAVTVAPECSGIHSTMVLVITSLLGGYLFLRRFWTRAVLVLAVIPLAILRNGFRISVIGWLCVHVSPEMIHSPIHRKGGPIFFVLSLIPFFVLLLFLRKQDSRTNGSPKNQPEN